MSNAYLRAGDTAVVPALGTADMARQQQGVRASIAVGRQHHANRLDPREQRAVYRNYRIASTAAVRLCPLPPCLRDRRCRHPTVALTRRPAASACSQRARRIAASGRHAVQARADGPA
jgi:hypothetical protein